MATPLDIGLLGNFQIIFPFLFVFCIVFAALTYTKFMGDNAVIHSMIAIVLSFMTLFSDIAVETINTAAPWFVLLIIFTIFMMLAFMVLGVRDVDITGVVKNPEYSFVVWWLVAIVLIIVIGSLSHVVAEKKGGFGVAAENATETGDQALPQAGQEGDFWQTLFHPKVLGMVAVLLIAMLAVSKLTSKA